MVTRKIIFGGFDVPKKIHELPEGTIRYKIRIRPDEIPVIFVRVPDGIRQFTLCWDEHGRVCCDCTRELARNVRG